MLSDACCTDCNNGRADTHVSVTTSLAHEEQTAVVAVVTSSGFNGPTTFTFQSDTILALRLAA